MIIINFLNVIAITYLYININILFLISKDIEGNMVLNEEHYIWMYFWSLLFILFNIIFIIYKNSIIYDSDLKWNNNWVTLISIFIKLISFTIFSSITFLYSKLLKLIGIENIEEIKIGKYFIHKVYSTEEKLLYIKNYLSNWNILKNTDIKMENLNINLEELQNTNKLRDIKKMLNIKLNNINDNNYNSYLEYLYDFIKYMYNENYIVLVSVGFVSIISLALLGYYAVNVNVINKDKVDSLVNNVEDLNKLHKTNKEVLGNLRYQIEEMDTKNLTLEKIFKTKLECLEQKDAVTTSQVLGLIHRQSYIKNTVSIFEDDSLLEELNVMSSLSKHIKNDYNDDNINHWTVWITKAVKHLLSNNNNDNDSNTFMNKIKKKTPIFFTGKGRTLNEDDKNNVDDE